VSQPNKARLNKNDERLCARFVDGEMTAAERAEFEKRMANDRDLAVAVQRVDADARAVRGALPETHKAPAGFSTAVLDKVRCMPSREDLIQLTVDEDTVASIMVYGRRLLVAAVVVFAISMLFSFQLFKSAGGTDLEADALKKQMDQLDQKVLELRKKEGPLRNKR
jgi:anti-sigma-K factor RskA